MTNCLIKEMFILFTVSVLREVLSIYRFYTYFSFGFEGQICDMILSVLDLCLSYSLTYLIDMSESAAAMIVKYTVELQLLEHRWLAYHDCFELVL